MHFVSRASLLAAVLVAAPAFAQNPWGEVRAPSAGGAEAIGGYAAGCVAGAVALPLRGEGSLLFRPLFGEGRPFDREAEVMRGHSSIPPLLG